MKKSMKPLERFHTTREGRTVNHLARLPILMQFAAEHIGSCCEAFASNYRVSTESNSVCAREFGIDQMASIFSGLGKAETKTCFLI
jgi:hypothetical protein